MVSEIAGPPPDEGESPDSDVDMEFPIIVGDANESHPRPDGLRAEFVGGSYKGFHSRSKDWGIELDTPRLFSRVLGALKVLLDDEDIPLDELPSVLPKRAQSQGLPHPLHILAVGVLATLFHEWHHHLEELALSDLELSGYRPAYSAYRAWYSANRGSPNLINESLAESDSFDAVLWLLDLDKRPADWRRADTHWREEQLRRYGFQADASKIDKDRLPALRKSHEGAVQISEGESRANGGAYQLFDRFRRAEPTWGIPRGTPSNPPTTFDHRAGPPGPGSAYWRGVEAFLNSVLATGVAGARTVAPVGLLAAAFDGAAEKYASTFDSEVPVRFGKIADPGLENALVEAVVALARIRRKAPWAAP